MNRHLLNVYHRLPFPFKTIGATARGLVLRRWRYGPETEQFISEALDRESWPLKRLKQWQKEQLQPILERAATSVPYYRKLWAERRQQGDKSSWEELDNWNILRKNDLRENPESFVADDCTVSRMFRDNTSGTTGAALTLFFSRSAVRKAYAINEARTRRWYGVSVKDRWAILGGQLIIPFTQKSPPYWVLNLGLNQLYMSTHHLSPVNTSHYIQAMKRYSITHVVAYPSSISILANSILENKLSPPKIKVIFSNAEVLTREVKELVRKAFGCPVVNTYGMSEFVAGASECPHGGMHIWPEAGIIEVMDDFEDRRIETGHIGRLLLTGLLNPDMPLIRYEVGDRGALASEQTLCSCGRSLPLISTLEGRTNDMITTSDGRKIFWLNPIFYELPIKEGQIIQEDLKTLRVRFVPGVNYSKGHGEILKSRLIDRVGQITVDLEEVEQIPRSANGKFQAVISRIGGAHS